MQKRGAHYMHPVSAELIIPIRITQWLMFVSAMLFRIWQMIYAEHIESIR